MTRIYYIRGVITVNDFRLNLRMMPRHGITSAHMIDKKKHEAMDRAIAALQEKYKGAPKTTVRTDRERWVERKRTEEQRTREVVEAKHRRNNARRNDTTSAADHPQEPSPGFVTDPTRDKKR